MSPDQAVDLCRQAAFVSLIVAAPVLACAVIVGLAVSIMQAVTQLQDQTLGFVPKIVAMGFVLIYVLPWALGQMLDYSTDVFAMIPLRILS